MTTKTKTTKDSKAKTKKLKASKVKAFIEELNNFLGLDPAISTKNTDENIREAMLVTIDKKDGLSTEELAGIKKNGKGETISDEFRETYKEIVEYIGENFKLV